MPYNEAQIGWEYGNSVSETLKIPKLIQNNSTNIIGSGAVLETLITAIATTAEFTSANGGVAIALARINSLLTVVNAVYISDLAIKFELITNNASFIFTNVSTDPFNPTSNYSTQDSQNAFNDFNTDNSLPYSNHDAHTLHANTTTTGNISSGGIAGLGVICNCFNKARGWTVSDEIIVKVERFIFSIFSKYRYRLGRGKFINQYFIG